VTDDQTVATASDPSEPQGRVSRRTVLRAGALGAAGVGAASLIGRGGSSSAAALDLPFVPTYSRDVHLAATDGWVSMPSNATSVPGYWPDELAPAPYNMYVFGFRDVTALTPTQVIAQRGAAQISAPLLAFDEGSEIRISLTNLGLSQRPDLVDGHTIHWHGFNNAIPLFDGVPELSASVPIGKSMTYYYRPHDAGTFMYHCHFEDVEHVQMGMTGLVFVRPLLNYEIDPATRLQTKQKFDANNKALRYLYNDESTRYDREFPLFLSENQPESHWRDAHIQITDWAEYKPGFALFNGRAYPDTIAPSTEPNTEYPSSDPLARLRYQPQTSRIDCNVGEIVALRVASLGYIRHTLTVDGIPLHVVGADASQLKSLVSKGGDGTDNSYESNSVDVAPGESRDVLFTAPSAGTYLLYDRDFSNLSNAGDGGYGGMITEIHVHAGTPDDPFVPDQPVPSSAIPSKG
jgi:FtsP/CotA-like multicopper oxidase with cupredoxin domain